MLADAGGWEWIILFIYIIPVVVGYKAVKRLFKTTESKYAKENEEGEPRRMEASRFYGLVFIIPIVIFITFIAFRVFAPGEIYSENLQSQIFHGYWIYVLSGGIPLALVGIGWGLREMYRNTKSPLPMLSVLASFAVLLLLD